MNSPNNIVIDQIPDWAIYQFHLDMDRLRETYGVRIRIKDTGKTSSPVRDLPTYHQAYLENSDEIS